MPDVTIAYKNSTIASITGSGAVSLSTAGRYCEDDITVTYTKPTPKLQEKTITPTTEQQIVTPDKSGQEEYDGLSKVIINAIPSANGVSF